MADSERESENSEVTGKEEKALPKPEDTEDSKITGQSESDDETNEEDDGPDPIELFKETFKKVELEKLQREAVEQAKREMAAEQAAQQQEQAAKLIQEKLSESFEKSIKDARQAVLGLKFYDEDGNNVRVSDEDFQKIVKPWNDHNSQVTTLTTQKIYSDVATAVNSLLTQAEQQEFFRRANDKPLSDYFSIFADLMAEKTPTYKKLKEDQEVAVSAAEAKGFARGQKGPKGTPKQENERNVEGKGKIYDGSLASAARAVAAGQMSSEEYIKIFNNWGKE